MPATYLHVAPGVWILKNPRIAVVGAGPGGLILARTLHIHAVAAAVFEREQFSSARPRGGFHLFCRDGKRVSGEFFGRSKVQE